MLILDGVAKTFFPGTPSSVRALDRVSLTIPEGQFVQVIGSNGAGKSTLLKAIAGIVTPDEGRITLDGRDITRVPEHERARRVGRIAQDPNDSTCAGMSVQENLALALRRGRARGLRRAVSATSRREFGEQLRTLRLGLEHRQTTRVGALSGGQRQALALLMAAMGEPCVLLLDEHLASLDPATAETVMQTTASIVAERRMTTLMVTHSMQHAIRWGDRLIMMHAGRIVSDLAGDEKGALTVEALVQKFHGAAHDTLAVDRMRLA